MIVTSGYTVAYDCTGISESRYEVLNANAAGSVYVPLISPAVSALVARLEADLGVRLFERRPFRLTSAVPK